MADPVVFLIGAGEYSSYNVHYVMVGERNPTVFLGEFRREYGFEKTYATMDVDAIEAWQKKRDVALARAMEDLGVTLADLQEEHGLADSENATLFARWLVKKKGYTIAKHENVQVGAYGCFEGDPDA